MFALIESARPVQIEGGWTGRVWSFAAHSALAALAVLATRPAATAPGDARDPVEMIWTTPAPRAADAPPAVPGVPAVPDLSLRVPVTPPTVVIGPVPPVPVDPGATPLIDVPPGSVFTTTPGAVLPPGSVHQADVVDEPPQRLTSPPLRYPEMLRQAGMEGRIMVEAVLDTLGVVERGSLRVVQGAHALFEAEAVAVVAASRYRAARVGGRAVRVRIQVPVAFSLRR
jgi:TonB family protein